MPYDLSAGKTYRRTMLRELRQLLAAQDRQLPRLHRTGNYSVLEAAERLRNKTVNLIQRLLAEDESATM